MFYHKINLNNEQIFNAQYTKVAHVGTIITMQNISHQKDLNRLKNYFAHTSHDLRSPLTAVLGYAELLERVGTLNQQQKEFVRRIHTSVEDITGLIDHLLDWNKIESNLSTHQETVRVDKILRNTLDNIKTQTQEKNHILKISIASNLPNLRGNPAHIQQIFDNLICNAIKCTPAGKKNNDWNWGARKGNQNHLQKAPDRGDAGNFFCKDSTGHIFWRKSY